MCINIVLKNIASNFLYSCMSFVQQFCIDQTTFYMSDYNASLVTVVRSEDLRFSAMLLKIQVFWIVLLSAGNCLPVGTA
jgi:hypothetical protein